jgi:hypothetical protein
MCDWAWLQACIGLCLDCASVLDLSVTALDVGYVERRDKIRVKEPLDQEKVT